MLATMATAVVKADGDMVDALVACEERCGDLSKFISKFSDVVKLPDPEKIKIELNGFVESAGPCLQTLCIPRGIDLSLKFSDKPVYVDIDIIQFHQVLVNIVKNSAESIDSIKSISGEIDIVVLGEAPGLVVIDNGTGISQEVACNLFSPFYSTKSYGNGIGLTLIAEVLKKHNCRFSLVTSPADGLTRFTINFPKHY